MTEPQIDEQMFLRQYYSRELDLGNLKKIRQRQSKAQTPTKPAFDYLEVQQNSGDYNEGKPFHIVVTDKPIVVQQPVYALSEPPQQKLDDQTPHYSREQFDSETMMNQSGRKGPAEDETQPTQPLSNPEQQKLESTQQNDKALNQQLKQQVSQPKKQKHHNKSQSPDKNHKRKPYTKVPFHGLYFKRHIRSPRNDEQSPTHSEKTQKIQVNNRFFNQILSLKQEQLSHLEEIQLKNLNIILQQRLQKHSQHYKQLIKEKFYVQANELVKKIYDRRKIYDSQLIKISELEDARMRQSSEYETTIFNSISILKEKIKSTTKYNKQLAVRVYKNQQTEKKVEKRTKMLQFINDVTWQKITVEKQIKSKGNYLQKIQNRMDKIRQSMQLQNTKIDELLVEMKQMLEIRKSQFKSQKESQPQIKKPITKLKSRRAVSTGKMNLKNNTNLSRLTNIFYKIDRSVKAVGESANKHQETTDNQGRYSDNQQISYGSQTEQGASELKPKKLFYIKLPSVTLSHSLNIPHNPEEKHDINQLSPFKTMKKIETSQTPYVFGEGTINGRKRRFFKSSNSQLNLTDSIQMADDSKKTEQFDKLIQESLMKMQEKSKREQSPQKRFRTRNLTQASIEIIKEVDELNELGSIANSQRLDNKGQSSKNSRRFEIRSGTESQDISQNEYIPLRNNEVPEWLAS